MAQAGVGKRDNTPVAPVVIPGLEQLVAGIAELSRVTKQQGEELSAIRKARGISNALSVEGTSRRETQEVSWPLDMNRPISREKVSKGTSFFD